jgi:hypothetical protein
MDRLVTSAADVKCRAVVHEPGVATSGKSVTGALSTPFDRELEEIRSLLLGAATFGVARPTIQTVATVAMTRFSVLAPIGFVPDSLTRSGGTTSTSAISPGRTAMPSFDAFEHHG